ncbi:MAG TPA: RNA methyltransferase [Spirochaetia bacterium]|nr:RNA methyltransferase [Spirochaetia bacterium]
MSEPLPPHLEHLRKYKIVLCNPDSSFNVGAVCRAMKTMGFTRLAIAGRILNFDPEKIRFMAIHAYDVFESAERHDSLDEALRHTVLSAGVTRRHGKSRKRSYFLPEEFATRTMLGDPGDIALVFGNEEHGLTTEELAACSAAVHIPSSPEFPSLNLSHAVQVVTYSFFRAAALLHYGGTATDLYASARAVDQDRLEHLIDGMMKTLTEIGFFRISDSGPTRLFLRDVMARATLSPRESDEIANIFRKIGHIKS